MVPKPIVINGVFKGAPINGRKSMGNSLGLLYFTPIPVELFHSIYKLVGRGPPCTQKRMSLFSWAMKKNRLVVWYREFFSTQWYGDYFISLYKDPVMNQPVFHGKLRYFLPKVFREKSRTASHMRPSRLTSEEVEWFGCTQSWVAFAGKQGTRRWAHKTVLSMVPSLKLT